MSRKVFVLLFALVFGTQASQELHKYEDNEEDRHTLILSHVLFRHGDRTADVSTIYPTDPYINATYFPFGKGQLTLLGKQRALRLGDLLRTRYNNFLGPIYYPDILEGTSSAYPRTQMTLQLVLAGLFPPTYDYQIKENLNWQPIPYSYSSFSEDKLIATFRSCEKIFDIADQLETTPDYESEIKQYTRLFQYLTEFSGVYVNYTRLAFFIQNTLTTEEEWGFDLPEWTKKVYPEPLRQVTSTFWKVVSSTPKLRSTAIGNLLTKIIDDTTKKINGDLPDRKLFLYSGHDFTIVPMLAALGHYSGELLPYTAHLIFEVHNINNVYGFKIYFQDYKYPEPRLLKIGNCDTFCPVDDFVQIVKENLDVENWCT